MGWVVRTYGCDGGDEAEPHAFELLQDRDEAAPRFCPKCGAEFEEEPEPIPSRIAIGGSPIARASDLTYRQLEESSAARAAELDAPALKVTDLKDNLREGDVAAARVPDNVVTQFDREAQARGRPAITGWGGGYATPGARVGPTISDGPGRAFVGPGHIAMAAVQPEHAQRVSEAMAATPYKPAMERPEPSKFPLPRQRSRA